VNRVRIVVETVRMTEYEDIGPHIKGFKSQELGVERKELVPVEKGDSNVPDIDYLFLRETEVVGVSPNGHHRGELLKFLQKLMGRNVAGVQYQIRCPFLEVLEKKRRKISSFIAVMGITRHRYKHGHPSYRDVYVELLHQLLVAVPHGDLGYVRYLRHLTLGLLLTL